MMKKSMDFMRAGRGLAFCVAFSLGIFSVQASPQAQVPTPTQFQQMVPNDATIQYARNVSGKTAVEALSNKLGIDSRELARAIGSNLRILGPDPLGAKSISMTATWRHSEHVSTKEVLSGNSWDDSVKPMAVAGDTYTTHWSSGGWNYSATYTFNGQSWELTAYSATKSAGHGNA